MSDTAEFNKSRVIEAIKRNITVLNGDFVLRTACAQNKAWHDAGYGDLHIDVNFSSKQFHDRQTPYSIKKILLDTDMDAGFLDIEITESIEMEDRSVDVLNKLSVMGINTSVDDFGTGHSSLGVLKFPSIR